MNRELKFRVYAHVDNGMKMVYLCKLECDNGLWFDSANHIDDYSNKIMQYTGLKDKNGKEIYEGDILKMTNRNGDSAPNNYKVRWHERQAAFTVESINDGEPLGLPLGGNIFYKDKEVIGNIYETPALLNDGQKAHGSDTTKAK